MTRENCVRSQAWMLIKQKHSRLHLSFILEGPIHTVRFVQVVLALNARPLSHHLFRRSGYQFYLPIPEVKPLAFNLVKVCALDHL